MDESAGRKNRRDRMSNSMPAGAVHLGDAKAASSASTSAKDSASGHPAVDIEAFRRGDPDCFRILLKRFGPLIRGVVASYVQDSDDRDELYQHVSIRLLTQRTRYEDWGALQGWVTRLAHGCCRNWCAARAARRSALDRYACQVIPAEKSSALLDDPVRLLDYREFLESLDRALRMIPPRRAQAFTLVHIEGRTPAAAARKMRVSTATVRSHVRFAREKLRQLLEEAKNDLS